MLTYFLLLACLPLLIFATEECPVGSGTISPCGARTAVIMNNTNYMGTVDRANQLFDYILTLFSAYRFDDQNQVSFTLAYYGMACPRANCVIVYRNGQKTPDNICASFYNLQSQRGSSFKHITVYQIIQSLSMFLSPMEPVPYDHIILFSATTDQDDINTSGKILHQLNSSFTVVNMALSTDYSAWINTRVINMRELPFPDNFAETVIETTCGDQDMTTPGSQTTYTEYPTMHPSVGPTEPPSQNCPCNPSKSWNDIFLLFDGSNDLAENKFAELVGYVFSAMSQLTIGQAEHYQTRAGIITYGDNTRFLSDLDHYSDTDSFLDDIDNVKRTGTEGTNIVGAIDLAINRFQSPAHRPTSKTVIVIGASTYRKGNYDSPLVKAKTFKDNGGIIVVIAYGDLNADVAPELLQLASPGYYIDSSKKTATVQQLVRLICNANCFCPNTYNPDTTTQLGSPDDGCFQTSTLEATNQLAKHYCSREHQGKLSTVVTPAQQIFVSKDVTGKEPIYVGLERSHGQWTWADGTPFAGVINDNGGDCATLTRVKGYKTQFDSAQCRLPYLYSCQATPCSTEVFCTLF